MNDTHLTTDEVRPNNRIRETSGLKFPILISSVSLHEWSAGDIDIE